MHKVVSAIHPSGGASPTPTGPVSPPPGLRLNPLCQELGTGSLPGRWLQGWLLQGRFLEGRRCGGHRTLRVWLAVRHWTSLVCTPPWQEREHWGDPATKSDPCCASS